MSIRTLLCLAVALTVTGFASSDASAQRGRCGINQAFRYLGGGHSWGYHWRTPGPCVDYYNPWSYHNTNLRIGTMPQGSQSYMGRMGYRGSAGHYNMDRGPGTYEDHYPSMIADPSPSLAPNNVIQSEIDEVDDADSDSDAESILEDDESGKEGADEGAMMWPGFMESKTDRSSLNRYPVRNRK